MPRILLASYHFPPSSAVGALRPARLARLLPDFGYEIDVVCASVDQAAGAADRSQLRLIPDTAEIKRFDTPWIWGRNPHIPPPPDTPFRTLWWRVRAHAESLVLTKDWSWNWGEAASKVLARDIGRAGYDVFIVDAPPYPAIVPFVRIAVEEGVPLVIDLRDLWFPFSRPIPRWQSVLPLLRRYRWSSSLRDQSIPAADHIVLTSPDMADLMRSGFPDLDPSRFSSIPNAYGEVDSVPETPVTPHPSRPLRVVYTGSLAYTREDQALLLVKGMGELKRQGGPPVELVIAGDRGDSLVRAAEAEGISDQVRIIEWMERDKAIALQRDAGALLLLQPSTYLGTECAIPAKLFEYMARRRNVLAMVGNGPSAAIIRKHDLGVVITGETPASTADGLKELCARVEKHPYLPSPPEVFSEESMVSQFAQVLDKVLTAR